MSGSHGCALAVNGSVECWGDNDSGQIDAPQGEFVEVSVSGSRSCAVALDASVRCWGADADLAIPAGDFAKVYADSLCGLRTDGEYVCWGQDGRYGALLDAPESEFEALSMELGYACALSTDGEVSCWGSSANFEGDSPPAAAADGPFVSLSVGYGHACALAADGSVECWGNNDAGQAESRQGPFVQVTAGREFTCALDAAGEVSCWGHGSTDRRARALRRISAGHNFLCGILASDATVSCWPQRTGGGLLEDELLEDEPRGGGYVDVDAGRDYACALKADGQAVCWGYRDDLWEVFAFASEQRYRAIAVGYRAACGLRTDGTGHCWIPDWHPPGPGGQFAHVAAGPCGIRPTRNIECWGFTEHVGEPPDSIGPLTDAATGWQISCGIKVTSSAIACWDPETNHQRFAIEGSYSQISTAHSRICALTTNSALRCWFRAGGPALHLCKPGDCWNRQGEQSFDMPEGTFTKIAIGSRHACAIRTDGTVACWGSNFYNSLWEPSADEPDESDVSAIWWRPWPLLAAAAVLVAVAVVAAEVLSARRRRSGRGDDPIEPASVADPETTERALDGLIRSDHPGRPDTPK